MLEIRTTGSYADALREVVKCKVIYYISNSDIDMCELHIKVRTHLLNPLMFIPRSDYFMNIYITNSSNKRSFTMMDVNITDILATNDYTYITFECYRENATLTH